jgi:hypothetical protein
MEIGVRELRNRTSQVIDAVRAGEPALGDDLDSLAGQSVDEL